MDPALLHAALLGSLLTALLAPVGMIFARLHRLSRRVRGAGLRPGALGVALLGGLAWPLCWHAAIAPAAAFEAGRWTPGAVGALSAAAALLLAAAWALQRRAATGAISLVAAAAALAVAGRLATDRPDAVLLAGGVASVWCVAVPRLPRPDRTPVALLLGGLLLAAACAADAGDARFVALAGAAAAAAATLAAFAPLALSAGPDATALGGLWIGTLAAALAAGEAGTAASARGLALAAAACLLGVAAAVAEAAHGLGERRRLRRAALPPRSSPLPTEPPRR